MPTSTAVIMVGPTATIGGGRRPRCRRRPCRRRGAAIISLLDYSVKI